MRINWWIKKIMGKILQVMIVRKMVNIELENRNLQSHGPNDSLPPKVLQPSTKHHSLRIKHVLKGDISSSSNRILFCALKPILVLFVRL